MKAFEIWITTRRCFRSTEQYAPSLRLEGQNPQLTIQRLTTNGLPRLRPLTGPHYLPNQRPQKSDKRKQILPYSSPHTKNIRLSLSLSLSASLSAYTHTSVSIPLSIVKLHETSRALTASLRLTSAPELLSVCSYYSSGVIDGSDRRSSSCVWTKKGKLYVVIGLRYC